MTDMKEKVRQARGLSSAEVAASREKHGANVLLTHASKSFLRRFFENLGDPIIRILLVALAVNLVFVFRGGDLAETIGIGVSVFLAAFISALSESGGENAFKKLSAVSERQEYRVRRDGGISRVSIEDIVVGDVVLVGAGERIPADGYLLSGRLSVDQSAITGEDREVEKCDSGEKKPLPEAKGTVLRGCPVLSGEAQIEIFAVGEASFLGKISAEVQTDTRESPLKLRLSRLAKQISRLGYVAAALVALAYLVNSFVIDSGFEWQLTLSKLCDVEYLLHELLHAFMLGLTILVVAVPEGLPLMISVVLSSNVRRMVRDNVLVRKPVGIEAAGSMNILFTDKTGTLTEGKMSVDSIMTCEASKYSYPALCRRTARVSQLYTLCCTHNTAATLTPDKEAVGGNFTERALLRSVNGASTHASVTERLPFNSAIKMSAVRINADDGSFVLVKGAPEKLLPYVCDCVSESGEVTGFLPYKAKLSKAVADTCADGKRVLLIALASEMPSDKRIPPLTLVCAVSLCDPLRKEARASVAELRGAGVGVVMITGDSKTTAERIARESGILGGERRYVIDSASLARMSDTELSLLIPHLAVVARALPSDKSRLVRVAQSRGLVVGMTGDGINDAPALKLADVGFSMGSGTDVAKDASDVLILDNDLASIVKAVLYGRTVFKSIRKFITLQLTMNFCAVAVSMIGPFIGIDAPVTVVQMLWINIIMDTLGGLAFAGEAPSKLYMKEPPKRRDEPILNRYMVNQIVVLGGFTVALCLYFLLSPTVASHFRYSHDKIYLLTAFFALFIFTSVLNCFSSRSDRISYLSGITKNRAFIAIMLSVCAVQTAFIYLGGSVLRTMPLTPSELAYTLLLSLLVIPAELLRRILWRIRGKKNGF
ncbi:MAG: calcium-translocating P-type ATPase, PMCA-type [Ruminococcaceae bacterium]|nr:calcium-translocating P-type ATPase, PMCA-type [Oscillospiraceae bacterium]